MKSVKSMALWALLASALLQTVPAIACTGGGHPGAISPGLGTDSTGFGWLLHCLHHWLP